MFNDAREPLVEIALQVRIFGVMAISTMCVLLFYAKMRIAKIGMPLNHLIFNGARGSLVEIALQDG